MRQVLQAGERADTDMTKYNKIQWKLLRSGESEDQIEAFRRVMGRYF